jgi:hypothetical protein
MLPVGRSTKCPREIDINWSPKELNSFLQEHYGYSLWHFAQSFFFLWWWLGDFRHPDVKAREPRLRSKGRPANDVNILILLWGQYLKRIRYDIKNISGLLEWFNEKIRGWSYTKKIENEMNNAKIKKLLWKYRNEKINEKIIEKIRPTFDDPFKPIAISFRRRSGRIFIESSWLETPTKNAKEADLLLNFSEGSKLTLGEFRENQK